MRPWFWYRHTELWIGKFGFFFSPSLVGVETIGGQFYGYTKRKVSENVLLSVVHETAHPR